MASDIRRLPRSAPPARKLEPFEPFSPGIWQDVAAPQREWLVDGCFAKGTVVLFSGHGGLGKSLLMLQLMTATALGKPWLGLQTTQVRCFGMFCEDEREELHRRQEDVSRFYGCEMRELDDHVQYVSRVGMDNVLMDFDRYNDTPKATALLDQVRGAVARLGAQLIILDTVSDIFGGNEIVRNQVRRFVTELRKIAIEQQGCVIITAHPSNDGLKSGSGASGSTGWHNTVRSRVYLTKPKEVDDEDSTDERILRTMKNNYGKAGGAIRMRWERGVFRVVEDSSPINVVDKMAADLKILDALRSLVINGTLVLASTNQAASFANLLRQQHDCRAYSFNFMAAAQERLLASGKIVRIEMGPPSKRRVYLRPADMLYPGEAGGTLI